ncbi:NUDIX domain-containing protein [Ramlibacter albus]|uniref:GDP-mannose pyrophosphatase n=1 Tax=Ramlibacter albus TaxID=2079448 RepID=A0A923S417_9BURK|nr:NUDIX hydrolase [Ramlibacter albus]MBC5767149.1 NUDIX hydrolase [Ramlibacter albus]
MDDKHLIEEQVSREEVYKGRLLHAVKDTVRLPDGKLATREYVLHPGAVLVVPLLPDGRIVLERQYRYPVRQVMIEVPAGKIDPGEDLLSCAKRELLEETGYSGAEWAYAGKIAHCIGYSDEYIHIFFARGLTAGAAQLDEGEFLDTILATPEEFLAWCRDGKVNDSKTLVAALWLQNILSGAWKLDWRA